MMALSAPGCAVMYQEAEQKAEEMPVHCRTARGDIRMLQAEKAHVVEQLAMGATAIYPASMVVGILEGTEDTKIQVATGEYNAQLDAKITEIQQRCGV